MLMLLLIVVTKVTEKFITKSREKGLSYQGEKYPGINIRVEEQQGEKESSYTWLTITAPASGVYLFVLRFDSFID